MKKLLAVLVVILITAFPVTADINQNATLNSENAVVVKVEQEAWNYGSGDINQDVGVHVTGNYQRISQDGLVVISDPGYSGDVNNTFNGINLIIIDLNQYGSNKGSGDIAQGINVLVDGNMQILDQDLMVFIGEE